MFLLKRSARALPTFWVLFGRARERLNAKVGGCRGGKLTALSKRSSRKIYCARRMLLGHAQCFWRPISDLLLRC